MGRREGQTEHWIIIIGQPKNSTMYNGGIVWFHLLLVLVLSLLLAHLGLELFVRSSPQVTITLHRLPRISSAYSNFTGSASISWEFGFSSAVALNG